MHRPLWRPQLVLEEPASAADLVEAVPCAPRLAAADQAADRVGLALWAAWARPPPARRLALQALPRNLWNQTASPRSASRGNRSTPLPIQKRSQFPTATQCSASTPTATT